jgi:TPR repeat protein
MFYLRTNLTFLTSFIVCLNALSQPIALPSNKELDLESQRRQFGAASSAAASRSQPDIDTAAIVNSPSVHKAQADMRASLADANQQSQDRSFLQQMRDKLPKAETFVNEIKYPTPITVSPHGRDVVNMIRAVMLRPGERSVWLDRLQEQASYSVPEALNFMGWVFENAHFNVPRDMSKAVRFYSAAATQGYTPAYYNLALVAAYRRHPEPPESAALPYLSKALAVQDSSGRVCGMATFLSLRARDTNQAELFAQKCNSPLAILGNYKTTSKAPDERNSHLRDLAGLGVYDGFAIIAEISRPDAANDPARTHCTHWLAHKVLREARSNIEPQSQLDSARACLRLNNTKFTNSLDEQQAVLAVDGNVRTYVANAKKLQAQSKYGAGRSVPYLPFTSVDLELFSPIWLKK